MISDRFGNKTSVLALIVILLLTLVISVTTLHAAILYSDDFNDGVADGWTAVAGTWAEEGGEYSGFIGSNIFGVSIISSSATQGTITIEADYYSQADKPVQNGFIVFDYQNPSDYKIAGGLVGSGKWVLGNVTSPSAWALRTTYQDTINHSRWYRLKVEINGTNVKLHVDDDRDGSGYVLKAEYNYASMGTGGLGLYVKGGSTGSHTHFDNFTSFDDSPSPPVLSVSEPDGTGDTVLTGDIYSITYTLADYDDVTTAAFYYDTDNTGLDGTAITGACAAAAEGTGVTCSWDTAGMEGGSYYIYGISDDGVTPPSTAYSAGQVTINVPVSPPAYQRIKAINEKLDAPSAIATDASDRIYVAETSFNRLNIYSPGGHFLKRLEGLDNPFSIAVDSTGNIFVGNGKTGNVEIYDFDLNFLTKLGSGDGEFNIPCAIAID
ncbi:MAG TPA: hypothetical protein ENH82_17440, partial [bacterium]|nr:hypothetical protein [bacterium]